MTHRKTLLAASVIAGLCCLSGALHAQDTSQTATTSSNGQSEQNKERAQKAQVTELSTVTVTGIRASLQASMDTKRNADAIVEAITAEEIGKFPATNVAEALSQV